MQIFVRLSFICVLLSTRIKEFKIPGILNVSKGKSHYWRLKFYILNVILFGISNFFVSKNEQDKQLKKPRRNILYYRSKKS